MIYGGTNAGLPGITDRDLDPASPVNRIDTRNPMRVQRAWEVLKARRAVVLRSFGRMTRRRPCLPDY